MVYDQPDVEYWADGDLVGVRIADIFEVSMGYCIGRLEVLEGPRTQARTVLSVSARQYYVEASRKPQRSGSGRYVHVLVVNRRKKFGWLIHTYNNLVLDSQEQQYAVPSRHRLHFSGFEGDAALVRRIRGFGPFGLRSPIERAPMSQFQWRPWSEIEDSPKLTPFPWGRLLDVQPGVDFTTAPNAKRAAIFRPKRDDQSAASELLIYEDRGGEPVEVFHAMLTALPHIGLECTWHKDSALFAVRMRERTLVLDCEGEQFAVVGPTETDFCSWKKDVLEIWRPGKFFTFRDRVVPVKKKRIKWMPWSELDTALSQ